MVCHPCKGQFVIDGRSGVQSCDKAPPLKAVLLQYSTPDVGGRTAIVLMVGERGQRVKHCIDGGWNLPTATTYLTKIVSHIA